MAKEGLFIDVKKFDQDMRRIITKAAPELREKGMKLAGRQLYQDCYTQFPAVPYAPFGRKGAGSLRGSGSLFVNNKLVGFGDPTNPQSPTGKASKTNFEPRKKGETVAVVGFNAKYATRSHEIPHKRHMHPGTGYKFLESKLVRNKNKYMKIVADYIRRHSR